MVMYVIHAARKHIRALEKRVEMAESRANEVHKLDAEVPPPRLECIMNIDVAGSNFKST